MPKKSGKLESKKLSLAIHPSIEAVIAEIAEEENLSFSAQIRSLINKGLESYGKKVRGNKIVETESMD